MHYVLDHFWRLANQAIRPYMRTRKDSGELTMSDLRRCAIWEYALDEEGREDQDECTVRPRPDLWSFPGEWLAGNAFVRTRFAAAAGQVFEGMMMPSDKPDIFHMRPVILSTSKPVELTILNTPWERRPPQEQVAEAYAILQMTADTLFPLRVEPTARIGRLYARTVLRGFPEMIRDEDDPDAEPYTKWHR